ncbi:hypothetical protein CHARACLAT_019488 [Characodon lateralis]|uniref:Uncharacterized protein n=1 Tax=Characodon lateralis TaxID=208331 RepID=A0ABU7EVM1_9TELE|nr:hypothetical protein [Characodon lateralis]
MKGFMFCLLLLPFAVMAVQGQTRAQRRHVLIFLNEGLGATTEKATPAKITGRYITDILICQSKVRSSMLISIDPQTFFWFPFRFLKQNKDWEEKPTHGHFVVLTLIFNEY